MSKIVVINHLRFNVVVQAPGRPDDGTGSGFRVGGWAVPRMNSAS